MWQVRGDYSQRTTDDFRYHAEASIGILLRNSHVKMTTHEQGGDWAERGPFKGVKDG